MFGGDEQSFYAVGIQRHETKLPNRFKLWNMQFSPNISDSKPELFFKPKLSSVKICFCTKMRG